MRQWRQVLQKVRFLLQAYLLPPNERILQIALPAFPEDVD